MNAALKLPETLELGIFDGIAAEDYHATKAVSKSWLDRIVRSPAHLRQYLATSHEQTPAMAFGEAAHSFILERSDALKKYAVLPEGIDRRTKVGKEAYEIFTAQSVGKKVITADDYDRLQGMMKSVADHPAASALIRGGQRELSCFWKDEATGIFCKARPDILREDGTIVDVKTTENGSLDEFMRSIAKFRYHVQAAWYLAGLGKFVQADQFVFIAVEKEPPYAVGVYSIDIGALSKGQELMARDLARFAECARSGEWPAYSPTVESIGLPAWAW